MTRNRTGLKTGVRGDIYNIYLGNSPEEAISNRTVYSVPSDNNSQNSNAAISSSNGHGSVSTGIRTVSIVVISIFYSAANVQDSPDGLF